MSGGGGPTPRPWQRLSVRFATLFALAALLVIGAVGFLAYQRQRHEVADTVGTQLLNIARVAVLLIDPDLHGEVQRTGTANSPAYLAIQKALASVSAETLLTTPIYTLADFDPAGRQARVIVTTEDAPPAEPYRLAPELIDPLTWTFRDGVARFTGIYRNDRGTWITAVAPIVDPAGRTIAVLNVDYPLEIYLDRLDELRATLVRASIAGGLAALVLGALVARRLTRPISALTRGVRRVAGGDLSQTLPVQSSDEIGQLTGAFNAMLEGLRQRDFIRSAFGRYVSPEVAQTLLESPEGLRFGGQKREVTILMSDLRGYTRFAEQGDPAQVMDLLNGYLSRMTDLIIQHGGTINEFIGDAVFAVFGAPLAHADHADPSPARVSAAPASQSIRARHCGRQARDRHPCRIFPPGRGTLNTTPSARPPGGRSGQRLQPTRHRLDDLGAVAHPVPCGEPGGIVVGEPHLTLAVLPGEHLQGQIDADALRALHQGRTGPRIAEDQELGGSQRETPFLGGCRMIDPRDHDQVPVPDRPLEPVHRLRHRIRAPCGDEPCRRPGRLGEDQRGDHDRQPGHGPRRRHRPGPSFRCAHHAPPRAVRVSRLSPRGRRNDDPPSAMVGPPIEASVNGLSTRGGQRGQAFRARSGSSRNRRRSAPRRRPGARTR
jgi:class 3 adenylate cyclase